MHVYISIYDFHVNEMTQVFPMEDSHQGSQLTCYRKWMALQEQDLSELLQALNLNHTNEQTQTLDQLRELIEKNIRHFHEYTTRRSTLAKDDIAHYFSPTWCTSLECSMLWAGGCRPSMFIRLIYTLCGKEIESHLDEYLSGGQIDLGLGELSASQLSEINSLQVKAVQMEDELSKKLASLQEEIADQPIAIIAKEVQEPGELSREANVALDAHAEYMRRVLDEADNLRLNIMKDIIGILTPIQAVDFLAAGKKLSLCLHAWGKRRDVEHGRF